ncbi:MAG: serine hydrolase [Bacteroidota bacterium]
MKNYFILLTLLITIGCQPSSPNPQTPFAELIKLVDQYAEQTLKQGNINSLAVAIYKDSLSYRNYYGEIDKNQGNRPNDSTLYEIASISKIFVGSLAAKAVVEKKISLDDDIRMYLDGDYENLEFDGSPVKVRHLLSHTLGFEAPDNFLAVYRKIFDGFYQDKTIDYSMEDLLEELKTVALIKQPGTYYDYSNAGPELMAHILEQVYEKPYKDLLSAFFDDLGLQNTHLQDFEKHEKYLSNGYDEQQNKATLIKNPLLGGAGGIISTLPDLTKFMQFQLESSEPWIKESTRLLFEDGEDDTGYFWDLGRGTREGFYYKKSGSSNGIQSILLICPDANYGLILIMNNQSDEALYDWIRLYNRIENDLIEYPKINAWSSVEMAFLTDPKGAAKQYQQLAKDTATYFAASDYLNGVGYDFLGKGQVQNAIALFELAVSVDPENANLHDSLGETYFIAQVYDKSKEHYKKSLELDPTNDNAKKYLSEIDRLLSAQ